MYATDVRRASLNASYPTAGGIIVSNMNTVLCSEERQNKIYNLPNGVKRLRFNSYCIGPFWLHSILAFRSTELFCPLILAFLLAELRLLLKCGQLLSRSRQGHVNNTVKQLVCIYCKTCRLWLTYKIVVYTSFSTKNRGTSILFNSNTPQHGTDLLVYNIFCQ